MSKRITIIRTWARFKQLMEDLDDAQNDYDKFQLEDCNGYYQLAIVNGIEFTIDLEKGTADATDYENNFKSGFIICNCSTD